MAGGQPRIGIARRARALLRQETFRRNPVRALWRRLAWRVRWRLSHDPWRIRFGSGQVLLLPRVGSGALIYFQGFSEPDTADFVLRFLRPGMTCVDVGAHIGEYTVLAAAAVVAAGEVHAFEPDERMFEWLARNVAENNLANVRLVRAAVSEQDATRLFQPQSEPALSSLRADADAAPDADTRSVRVRSVRLDSYWAEQPRRIDLVKVDVEGAERLVVGGAERLLTRAGNGPTWLFECSARNYARFGYSVADVFHEFERHRYRIVRYDGSGRISGVTAEQELPEISNLLATRDPEALARAVAGG